MGQGWCAKHSFKRCKPRMRPHDHVHMHGLVHGCFLWSACTIYLHPFPRLTYSNFPSSTFNFPVHSRSEFSCPMCATRPWMLWIFCTRKYAHAPMPTQIQICRVEYSILKVFAQLTCTSTCTHMQKVSWYRHASIPLTHACTLPCACMCLCIHVPRTLHI